MDSITIGLAIEGIGRERGQPCFFPLSLPIHFSIFSFSFALFIPLSGGEEILEGSSPAVCIYPMVIQLLLLLLLLLLSRVSRVRLCATP